MGDHVPRASLQAIVDAGVLSAVSNAVADNTRDSQVSAVRAWERFCSCLSVHPDLILSSTPRVEYLSLEDTITVVAQYTSFEVYRGMAPASIKKVYIPSIAREFDARRVLNHFRAAANSSYLKSVMAGHERIYFKGDPAAGHRRCAFTASFQGHVIPACDAAFGQIRPHLLRLAEPLAIKMGMWFCLRKSEYLPHTKGPRGRGLALADITLSDMDSRPIAFRDIRVGGSALLTINIRYSKTDQHGHGRIRQLAAVFDEDTGARRTCLVRDLEEYLVHLRDFYPVDPSADFLFAHGMTTVLNADHVRDVIKATVLHAGMDPTAYSPHSLRYGGATMLAAAGVPIYLIEYHGGWVPNSASVRNYLQIGGVPSARRIAKVMADCEDTGLEEVRLAHHIRVSTARDRDR